MRIEVVDADTPERLEAVRSLLHEYVEFMAGHWDAMDREAWAEEIAELPSLYPVVLLALGDGEPAGCVVLRLLDCVPDAAEVRRMYVRPSMRRRGVASGLMAACDEHALAMGYDRLVLVAVKRFHGAHDLYGALGYEVIEPYRASTMPPEMVTFMAKRIREA